MMVGMQPYTMYVLKLRKLKAQHPEISVAIIDYLQLMSGEGKEGRQQEVSEISSGLKQLSQRITDTYRSSFSA